MTTPRKIIIDTDPGQDDAVAILLALASPEDVAVLGITAVAGNVPLPLTERNARIICELARRPETRVFAGCDAPLKRKLVTAEHVHGKTGLDGPQLADPVMPLQPGPAVDFIIDTLRREPSGTVTLCPLGPLTNIATAFVKAPDIVGRVEQIVNAKPEDMRLFLEEAAGITRCRARKITAERKMEPTLPASCSRSSITVGMSARSGVRGGCSINAPIEAGDSSVLSSLNSASGSSSTRCAPAARPRSAGCDQADSDTSTCSSGRPRARQARSRWSPSSHSSAPSLR